MPTFHATKKNNNNKVSSTLGLWRRSSCDLPQFEVLTFNYLNYHPSLGLSVKFVKMADVCRVPFQRSLSSFKGLRSFGNLTFNHRAPIGPISVVFLCFFSFKRSVHQNNKLKYLLTHLQNHAALQIDFIRYTHFDLSASELFFFFSSTPHGGKQNFHSNICFQKQ